MARSRTIVTPDGARLYLLELGPDARRPVVVLHGGPGAHHDYLLPAFATLADEHRLVLYDQRGGGRSREQPPGTDLGWERHVEDVGAVLDALGAHEADLVGYSFGGLWAMLFAARRPDRVRRLALVSSVPGWYGYRDGLERALAAAQRDPAVVAERDALERSGMRESAPEEYRRRRFALSIAGYLADPRLAHAVTPFRVQARAAEVVRAGLGDFDFREELAGSLDGARTLIVHGERDPIAPELARDLAVRVGARFELLPGCGHVPYVEAPASLFGILRAFLGGSP